MQFHQSKIKTCVYCGASPVTKEHVIPEWITSLPIFEGTLEDIEKNIRTPHYLTKWGTREAGTEMEMPEFVKRGGAIRPHQIEVKVVCGPKCNEGWMSELEVTVAKFLKPLIHGEHTPLTAMDLHDLARWACKTSMMYEFNDRTTLTYTKEQYSEAYLRRGIVNGVSVHIAWFRDSLPLRIVHTGAPEFRGKQYTGVKVDPFVSAQYRLGVTVIVIGHVALMVHNATAPEHTQKVESRSKADPKIWSKIHPIQIPEYVDNVVVPGDPEIFATHQEVLAASIIV